MNSCRSRTSAAVGLLLGLSLPLCACSSPAVAVDAATPGATVVTCRDNTSDAGRIQAAINASSPGAVIQLNGGTCLLTQGLVLTGNRTYAGGSTTGTVLKQDGSMGYVLASSDYTDNSTTTGNPLQIRDLTVDCSGAGDTDGIVILNWQVVVEEVDVHGCGGTGIVDTSVAANNQSIGNTSVNSRFNNDFISNSGHYGFAVIDPVNAVTDGFFTDNQVADSGADAVYLQNAEGWNISGNHLYGDSEDGIEAQRLYGTTIASNYIEDFGTGQQSGTWYGITGTVQDGPGSVFLGNKVFSNGEQAGAGHVYIAVTTANSGTGHLSVYANVVQTSASTDQAFFFNGAPNHLVVAYAANQVSGPGAVRTIGDGVTINSGN
jgi:Right handed beta helix region